MVADCCCGSHRFRWRDNPRLGNEVMAGRIRHDPSIRYLGEDWELAKNRAASACSVCVQAIGSGEKSHRPAIDKGNRHYRRICRECGTKLVKAGTAKEITA